MVTNNSCKTTDTVRITFDPCTGIQNNKENKIIYYPNPTNDFLNISTDSEFSGSMSIVNSIGWIVKSDIVSFGNLDIFKVDVSSLKEGLYYLILRGETIKSFKFIIY